MCNVCSINGSAGVCCDTPAVPGEDWNGPDKSGASNVYPGAAVVAGDVCGLLCSPRHVRQVRNSVQLLLLTSICSEGLGRCILRLINKEALLENV